MPVHRAHMLSTSLLQGAPLPPSRLVARDLLEAPVPRPGEPRPDAARPVAPRTRIWEFGVNLHCSIIGTCLSTAELRHIVAKAEPGAATASDHDLHVRG